MCKKVHLLIHVGLDHLTLGTGESVELGVSGEFILVY